MINTSGSVTRGRGLEPHSGRRVVSLSKTYLPPPPPTKKKKSTGYTQEAVAPSQHDKNIVYRDVKHQTKPNQNLRKKKGINMFDGNTMTLNGSLLSLKQKIMEIIK